MYDEWEVEIQITWKAEERQVCKQIQQPIVQAR